MLVLASSTFVYYSHLSLHRYPLAIVADFAFDAIQGLLDYGIAYALLRNLFVAVSFVVPSVAFDDSCDLVVVDFVPQLVASKRVSKLLVVVP